MITESKEIELKGTLKIVAIREDSGNERLRYLVRTRYVARLDTDTGLRVEFQLKEQPDGRILTVFKDQE